MWPQLFYYMLCRLEFLKLSLFDCISSNLLLQWRNLMVRMYMLALEQACAFFFKHVIKLGE